MASHRTFGIDLGTTNSAIATVDENRRPFIVPNREGGNTTPSVVQIGAEDVITGELARRQVVLEKDNTAQFFKLDMGTAITYTYRGHAWTPVDLSVQVLRKVKDDAEAYLGCPVPSAVITVPAYFQDAARVATRVAGERAGLKVLQIINEPTAAALAYGLRGTSETILVYDLGGGTFDITLARVSPEGVEVIGTAGNHTLGGKNWDDRLIQYVAEQFRVRYGPDPLDDAYTFQELLARGEQAKVELSSKQTAAVGISTAGKTGRIEVTRGIFEDLTRDLLIQTEMLMEQVLEETGYNYAKISSVLMVGGSTRMPACRQLVERITGRPPNLTINPAECVALGAAIQASMYDGSGADGISVRLRIDDVMSHSMGMIAVSGDGKRYINSVLIPKHRRIPCREVRPYAASTLQRNENTISVYVTQGEGEDPTGCSFVGKYTISQIPHGKNGITVLDIAYAYDRSGVVEVSARVAGHDRDLPIVKESELGDMSWVFGSPGGTATVLHKTVCAAVDLSGSMCGDPLAQVKKAVDGFIEKLDLPHTGVGLISFADEVSLDQQITHDATALHRAVQRWDIGQVGGGNGTDPFAQALDTLRNESGERWLIVLTDGVWSHQRAAVKRAAECRDAGIQIIAIGFGAADEKFLRQIATADEGALYVGTGELASTFGRIARELAESGLAVSGGGGDEPGLRPST